MSNRVRKWLSRSFGDTDDVLIPGAFSGTCQGAFTPNQDVTIAGHSLKTCLLVESNNLDSELAAIGNPILRDFRITIDYPRHKILWEPNPSSLADQKRKVFLLENGGKFVTEKGKHLYYAPRSSTPISLD